MRNCSSLNINVPLPEIVATSSVDELSNQIKTRFDDIMSALYPGQTIPRSKLLDVLLDLQAEREFQLREFINSLPSNLFLTPPAIDETSRSANPNKGSSESDLDNLAIFFGVRRLDKNKSPPTSVAASPDYEDDDSLKKRLLFAPERLVNGTEGAYIAHLLSYAPFKLRDVTVSIIAELEGGTHKSISLNLLPQLELLIDKEESTYSTGESDTPAWFQSNKADLNNFLSRVKCVADEITLKPATIKEYSLDLTIEANTSDEKSLKKELQDTLANYTQDFFYLGKSITHSYIKGLIDRQEITKITIAQPPSDISCDINEAAYCSFTLDKDGSISPKITINIIPPSSQP